MSLNVNEFAPPLAHPSLFFFFSLTLTILWLADVILLSCRLMGTVMMCLAIRGVCVSSSFSISLRRGETRAWSTSLCVQFLETSSSAVLTLTSVLFSSCCTCFSIAANRLNTDSAQHQHTAFKCLCLRTSPRINIYNHIVYPAG